LSSHSWPFEARPGILTAAQKWSGPALAALGLLAMAADAVLATRNPFAGWFLLHALAPERILPLIGLGVAGGLVDKSVFAATLLLFSLGIASGFAAENWLLATIYALARGPTHLFLTEPISCLAIGLALVPGMRFLTWLLPVAAYVAGAMLALAIFLTAPSLHDPIFVWVPLLAAVWLVAALALTLRAFRRRWFAIFGRILGSWLVAIGLLYGGVSLALNFNPSPPPTDTSQESTRGRELGQSQNNPPAPEQPAPFADGVNGSKQPWTTINPN
jgi:hypothetical protein